MFGPKLIPHLQPRGWRGQEGLELERKFGGLVANMLYDPSLKRGLASLYLKFRETGGFDKCPPAHSCHLISGVHLVPGE